MAGEGAGSSARHSVAESEHRFSDGFRERQPRLWLASLVAPFAVTLCLLIAIGVHGGWGLAGTLVREMLIAFFAAGRFIILAGGDAGNDATLSSLTRGQLFLLVSYMDLFVASLLVVHAGVIFRIPRIGPQLAALQEDGEFVLSMHPWMRRATWIGMILFIVFPLAATGSVGGSILGRLLGMTRLATFSAIMTGSVIGNGIMWLFAGVISDWLNKDDPLLLVGGIAVIAGIIMFLNARYRKMKQSARVASDQPGSA